MGRISSSIGLMTGTDIVGTVDKLMAISSRPQQRLIARNEKLQEQQAAIAELTALVIGVQLAGGRLNAAAQFQARSAVSSQEGAVSVTAAADAQLGSFTARPIQLAATHAAQSDFKTADSAAALGWSGSITVRGGGFLNDSVSLSELNQGRGVAAGSIRISDRAGNTAEIDLSAATTVNDVIDAINQASGIRVRATTVGDQIRLDDHSGSTAHHLRVQEVGGGETAADLGLRGIDVAGDTAVGHDIFGAIGETTTRGLQGVLLSELAGGAGALPLGSLDVTLTDGSSGSIDLSSATTTHDVMRLINDSGLAIEARINDAGNGLRLRDLSGGNAGPFSVSSSDATAAKLGLNRTAAGRMIEGGDLERRFVTEATPLKDLRQGRGISGGTFSLVDSTGATAVIDLSDAEDLTVGDLIQRVNDAGLKVKASLNAGGDGIALTDTGRGTKALKVVDLAGGQTAADLALTGTAETLIENGLKTQRLVSAERQTITISAGDSLDSIAAKFNESSRLATASVVQGSDGQFSLVIRSARGGDAGRLAISSDIAALGMSNTVVGRDAVMSVTHGDGSTEQIRSIDGVFTDVVPGVSLTAKSLADQDVSINVTQDTATAVSNVKAFVTQYNKLTEKLQSLTFFSGDPNTSGLLFGSGEALRIETTYTRLLSGEIFGAGDIRSLREVGLSFNAEGELQFDEFRFADRLTADDEAVKTFFTKEQSGLVARLNSASDRLAGVNSSLLISRSETLGQRILRNNEQVDSMQVRLDAERERLLRQFLAAEEAIAKLQTNQNAISQIQMIRMPSRER